MRRPCRQSYNHRATHAPLPFRSKLVGSLAHALHTIDGDACGVGRVGRVEYVVEAAACAPSDATARAS